MTKLYTLWCAMSTATTSTVVFVTAWIADLCEGSTHVNSDDVEVCFLQLEGSFVILRSKTFGKLLCRWKRPDGALVANASMMHRKGCVPSVANNRLGSCCA